MMRTLFVLLLAGIPLHAQITVRFPRDVSSKPHDGRVLLLLSTDPSKEPRMQIDDSPNSQMIFGVTVDNLAPGQPVTVSDKADGYPIRSLKDVPPGDYYVQAVLNIYQTFHRGDGATVKLAPDRGEGQHWNLAPGNLYSQPMKAHIDSHSRLDLLLTAKIPPIVPPADTKYIRHLRVQSELLTKFWGTRCFCRLSCWCRKVSMSIPPLIFPSPFLTTTLSTVWTNFAPPRRTPTLSRTTRSVSTWADTTILSSRRPTRSTNSGSAPAFPGSWW